MMLLMSTSVDAYFDSIPTDSVSDRNSAVKSDRYFSLESSLLCGDWSSMASHNVSMRRPLPISISDSLIILYSVGASVVLSVSLNQRRDIFPTITMHVDTICECACTLSYAVSRYILPISMHCFGHLS